MKPLLAASLATATAFSAFAQTPKLPGVGDTMQEMIGKNEIAGAITVVVTKDKTVHWETTGLADVAAKRPMTPDTLFRIASMTKPVTGVAILMLQDDGKLHVTDPVAKYLPEFASLKTPSGKPANLTIAQILTHTSGIGEADTNGVQKAKTLSDLVPLWLAAPMQYEPGEKWKYTQSGINAAGRIVEVVSGMTFDAFLQQRLFDPLGMTNTTFYPTAEQRTRLATCYAKNKDTGALEPVPPRPDLGQRDRPPQGNGGLYSTAPDYARFCQMLLNGGTLEGRRYLSAAAMKFLSTPQTGDLPTGFFQNETYGHRGTNYGWGIGTCVLRTPHAGVAEMLSPGSYGHGGAWGTQAWIDPLKGVAYVMMVQRANFPNSDASEVRREFQKAAASALANGERNQPAGPAIGTPVSTNFQGLRTTRTYQPLPRGTNNSAAVRVVAIDDELRNSYRIDPFYKKTLTSAGVVIVGSDKVSDWAFLEAAYTLDHQLHDSPNWVREALTTNKVRLAILAVVEYTMDLPENNRRSRTVAEAAFQDRRSRGLGGMPNCSCAEENLLNLRGDPYGGDGSPDAGENITVHEFAHTLASAIGRYQGRDGPFWTKLRKGLADAKAPTGHLGIFNKDRRSPVYASSNEQEYWAEGTQAWFDHANPRNSGGLDTRDDVKQKDPQLAALLAEIYGDGPWRYHKTTAKNTDGTPMRSKDELAHLEGLDALRDQFPVYNNRNSPRIIALAKEQAAKAAEASSTNAPVSATTNAPPPATGENQPSTR